MKKKFEMSGPQISEPSQTFESGCYWRVQHNGVLTLYDDANREILGFAPGQWYWYRTTYE